MVGYHMDKVVVSIGGSILVPGENDAEFIRKLADMLKEVSKEVQVAVVCGGGKTARYYAGIAKDLGGDTYAQDILGIAATRMNAQLLSIALGDMPDTVTGDMEETAKASVPGKIVVMGGTVPGHTTDAVSSMLAAAMKADRIVNGTSVDAVYTDDPRKNPDAKKITSMTIDELGDIVLSGGATIYRLLLDECDELVLTEVETEAENVDVWFPEYKDKFEEVSCDGPYSDGELKYYIRTYKHK